MPDGGLAVNNGGFPVSHLMAATYGLDPRKPVAHQTDPSALSVALIGDFGHDRQELSDIVGDAGPHVTFVSNPGHNVRAQLGGGQYDAVFLDGQLPGSLDWYRGLATDTKLLELGLVRASPFDTQQAGMVKTPGIEYAFAAAEGFNGYKGAFPELVGQLVGPHHPSY